MTFKKGEIPKGSKPFSEHPENINKNGRPKKLPELEVLLSQVLSEVKDGKTAAEIVLMALRKKAVSGDVRAIELILNRAYGKQTDKFEGTVTQVEMPTIIIERDPD